MGSENPHDDEIPQNATAPISSSGTSTFRRAVKAPPPLPQQILATVSMPEQQDASPSKGDVYRVEQPNIDLGGHGSLREAALKRLAQAQTKYFPEIETHKPAEDADRGQVDTVKIKSPPPLPGQLQKLEQVQGGLTALESKDSDATPELSVPGNDAPFLSEASARAEQVPGSMRTSALECLINTQSRHASVLQDNKAELGALLEQHVEEPDFIEAAAEWAETLKQNAEVADAEAATLLPSLDKVDSEGGLDTQPIAKSWHGFTPFDDIFRAAVIHEHNWSRQEDLSLEEQLEFFQKNLVWMQNQIKQMYTAWLQSQEEAKALEQLYEQTQAQEHALAGALKELTAKYERLDADFQEKNQQFVALRCEKEHLVLTRKTEQEQLQYTLGSEVDTLKKQIETTKQNLAEMEQENAAHQREIHRLQNQIEQQALEKKQGTQETHKKIAELEHEKKELHYQYEQSLKKTREMRQSFEEENMVQQQTFIRLRDTLTSQRLALDSKDQKIAQLEGLFQKNQQEILQKQKKAEEALQVEKEKTLSLQNQLEMMQTSLNTAQEHMNQMQQEFQRDMALHQENAIVMKKILEQNKSRCLQLETDLDQNFLKLQEERNKVDHMHKKKETLVTKVRNALEIAEGILSLK